jgi:diguanylate cyclase (GGDEF)-like protein
MRLGRLFTRNPRELPHLEQLERTLVDDLYRRSATTVWFLLPALLIFREIVRSAYDVDAAVRAAFWATMAFVMLRWAMVLIDRRRAALDLAAVRMRHRAFLVLTTLMGLGITATILLASPHLSFAEVAAVAVFLTGVHSVALGSMAASPGTYISYVTPPMAALMWAVASHPQGSLHKLLLGISAFYLPSLILMCLYAHHGVKKVIVLGLELRDLALKDTLTGLPNRRFLSEFVDREADQALRDWRGKPVPERRAAASGRSVGLLILDLDFFKAVNDQHGHAAGDEVLRQCAKVVQEAVRKPDLVVRWGGEEFVVAARELARDGIAILAERIRSRIADHPFPLRSGKVLRVTCSIGFSLFPFSPQHPELLGWEQVLGLADHALYQAKAQGRNRVVGIVAGEARVEGGEVLVKAVKEDFEAALAADLIRLAPPAGAPVPAAAVT